METRGHAKRAGRYAPAPAPASSLPLRATRETNPSSSRPYQPSPRKSQGTQESRGKLLRDPIPRRNAPVDTASIASITTAPTRVDDETGYGESTIYSVEEEEGSPVYEDDSEEIQVGLEANDARRIILELSISDLTKAADDLMEYMEKGDTDPNIFHGRLKIKRRAFYSLREEYEEEGTAPLIDWTPFLSNSGSLARANVVTAFDKLYDADFDNERDVASFLTTLSPLFPTWFVPEQAMFQGPEATLSFRTWLLIESLSRQTGEIDYRKSIASVFCKDTGEAMPKYSRLFMHGPFLELGGNESDDHDKLCSDRISEILTIIHKQKSRQAIVSRLREEFGLEKLVPELQSTFRGIYNILKPGEHQGSVQLDTQHFASYEGQDDTVLSSDIGSESQSIIRAATGEAEPSLFVGQESIRALQGGAQRGSTVPPSNQQLAAPRPGAPLDYREHSNSLLLRDSTLPPVSSLVLKSSRNAAPSPSRKRLRGPFEEYEEEDDDDEDPFETDTRSVKSIRREAPQGRMNPPPPKRSRAHVPAPAPESSLSQTHNTSPTAPPQSSMPNFEAVRESAHEVFRQARLSQTAGKGPQKRTKWSDNDSDVLIKLISEYHAGWSAIEEKCQDRFEFPRGQQAYRDKARNLKVEFLVTDQVLPPSFDEISLGPKEIARVTAVGKNPFRKEADVHGDMVINTELRTQSMISDLSD